MAAVPICFPFAADIDVGGGHRSAMLLIRAITLVTSVAGGLLYLQLKARQARSGVVAVEPSSVRPS